MSNNSQKTYKIKKDKYLRARGGTSKILKIDCSQCGANIAFYQKDGPGSLLRMYLDRIHDCENTRSLDNVSTESQLPNINCPACGSLIATPMIYEPEQRLAFRVRKGSIKKTIVKK